MNKQDAQNLLVFLQRVQLKGDEAVEFVRLSQLLAKITQGENVEQAVEPKKK
jgi:hypothetical protein